MIGSLHRKYWHPTLIIFGFIGIFQNRDIQTNRQTDKQTDKQTDNTNIYMIYIYIWSFFLIVPLLIKIQNCPIIHIFGINSKKKSIILGINKDMIQIIQFLVFFGSISGTINIINITKFTLNAISLIVEEYYTEY